MLRVVERAEEAVESIGFVRWGFALALCGSQTLQSPFYFGRGMGEGVYVCVQERKGLQSKTKKKKLTGHGPPPHERSVHKSPSA